MSEPVSNADELDRLRAENADLKERIDRAYEDIALDQRTNETLRAELAALKKADPIAEMWRELAEYQPQADRDGHGESWRIMCEERTAHAADGAASAADARAAYAVARATRATRAAWAAQAAVAEASRSARFAADAIAAIRRAKEAKP